MATPKLLLARLLRRRLSISASSSSSSGSNFCAQSIIFTTPERINRRPLPSYLPRFVSPQSNLLFSRYLSTQISGQNLGPSSESEAQPEEELSPLGFRDGYDVSDNGANFVETLARDSAGVGGEELIFVPVRALISLLDWYHHCTGFPWWVIIASSTLALRITLLPVIILQLHKLKKIADLLPKLPPPLPPPLSGRSFVDQFLLFRKEKRAVGCPSFLWFLAAFAIQAPSFILWMMSIRRMSLDQHPGFDCGGALWFKNLTEYPHGVLGPVFPVLIAFLHLLNVQVSFQTLSTRKASGLLSLLVQYYKVYLQILTVPILFAAFNIPQGSLVYWATNSSLSLIQLLSLNHPGVRVKLGLPEKVPAAVPAKSEEKIAPVDEEIQLTELQGRVPAKSLSPRDLVALSIKYLSEGKKERAVQLLRLALDKDPHYVRALIVMGQIRIQGGQLTEAIEYLERAISKLFLIGLPTEVDEVDLLILASQWAGVAYIKEGRHDEGLRHLERVANLKEPKDSKSKAHYYDSLVLLASALYREGRKDEAAKYLRIAVAYDSKFQELLDQCENDEDDFAGDLTSSRRGDY